MAVVIGIQVEDDVAEGPLEEDEGVGLRRGAA
jgi:hypothetical protein